MNISFSYPSDFRGRLAKAEINFSSDSFKLMLMRDGFLYNSVAHQHRQNVAGTTGAVNWYFELATKTFTRDPNSGSGSFVTDGFVSGNHITTDGDNNGVYVIREVTATTMRVEYVSGTTLRDEGIPALPNPPGVTWVSHTISSVDVVGAELTGLTFTVSGAITTLDTGSFDWSDFGGDLATSQGAIIYDDEQADPDKLIVAYLRFSPWTLSF